ncbi:MAG TPA: SAP domain-containing protein [Micromonosporaceae bacterium]
MLLVCGWCTTKFAVGVEHCPQCGNADYYPEGTMAKITKHGGASQVGVAAVVVAESEEPVVETEPEEVPADEEVLAEPPSVYETYLLADLRDECRERGLATSGNKAELVQRLIDDDAQAGGPEEAAPVDDEVQPVF